MPSMTGRPEDTYHTIEQQAQTRCFYCVKKPSTLAACSRCSRVSYCGADCQRADFPVHKHICKNLVAVRQLVAPSRYPVLTSFPPSSSAINSIMGSMSRDIMGPLMVRLGPRGGQVANFLVFQESRCSRCLKVGGAAMKKLGGCETCVTRWCEDEPCRDEVEEEHKRSKMCEKLEEISRDEVAIRLFEQSSVSLAPGSVPIYAPPRILRDPTPLPTTFDAYFSSLRAIPNTTTASTPSPVLPNDDNYPEGLHPLLNPSLRRTMTQHSLSLPLTVVASLYRFGLLNMFSDPKQQRKLTVHLIGAEVKYELLVGGSAWEEICHLLPGVKELRLVMVGPMLNSEESGPKSMDMECCEICAREGRRRIVELHSKTYHDYLRSHPSSPPADVAVAYNSGMHEDAKGWSPTIGALLKNRTPSVFTSFNATEAREDASVVSRKAGAGIEWVWRQEENEWRSGRRHFDLFSEGALWSENGYWMGWKGV